MRPVAAVMQYEHAMGYEFDGRPFDMDDREIEEDPGRQVPACLDDSEAERIRSESAAVLAEVYQVIASMLGKHVG